MTVLEVVAKREVESARCAKIPCRSEVEKALVSDIFCWFSIAGMSLNESSSPLVEFSTGHEAALNDPIESITTEEIVRTIGMYPRIVGEA